MTKQGTLILRTGRRIQLGYQVGSFAPDGVCSGNLIADLADLDPVMLADKLNLVCENGQTLHLLLTHQTVKGSMFVATVAQNGNLISVPGATAPLELRFAGADTSNV